MTWLTSQPIGLLVVGGVALALLLAISSRLAARAFIAEPNREGAYALAGPLMSPLGAGFAILAALTLANEAANLTSAETIVSNEAGDVARLAWAATTPGVHTAPVHAALLRYLQATRTFEWNGAQAAEGSDTPTAAAIADLENAVRSEAVQPGLGTPSSSELLNAIDAVTADRRARLAAQSRELPDLYVICLVVSGCALIANAGVLTVRVQHRGAVVIGGLTVVIGLSIALIFALDNPWRGTIVVSGYPIDVVIQDLTNGYFRF